MGVWQVTNETQPYIGKWDAKTDKLWDGIVQRHMVWPTISYGPCTGLTSAVIDDKWVTDALNSLSMRLEKEESTIPKAQDPWEALKSMF